MRSTGRAVRSRSPSDFAYLIVAVLPVSGYLFARESSRRFLWGACFLVILAAMLASLSRGAVVGLAALAVWAVAARRVPLGGIIAALLGVVAVIGVALAFWGRLSRSAWTRRDASPPATWTRGRRSGGRLSTWPPSIR